MIGQKKLNENQLVEKWAHGLNMSHLSVHFYHPVTHIFFSSEMTNLSRQVSTEDFFLLT